MSNEQRTSDQSRHSSFVLSRARIESFLACPRQFQLRYLERRAWPRRPLKANEEAMLAKGQLFHQLLQRHFAGLDTAVDRIQDKDVGHWWQMFQQHGPALPTDDDVRLLPEMSLTVPIPGFDGRQDGRYLLTGRFDLLVMSDAAVHVFDWKTGRPRPTGELRHDWQTRLYLALLAEGGTGLGNIYAPDQITLTYWFANAQQTPPTINYDQVWHRQNWADIQAIAAQIDEMVAASEKTWALTQEWATCRRCPYQTICGRQMAGAAEPATLEYAPGEFDHSFEPELPQ